MSQVVVVLHPESKLFTKLGAKAIVHKDYRLETQSVDARREVTSEAVAPDDVVSTFGCVLKDLDNHAMAPWRELVS